MPAPGTPGCAMPLLACILLAFGAPAAAQVSLDPQVSLVLRVDVVALDAGTETTFEGVVANDGTVDGTVTLDTLAREGWEVEVEPSTSFPLAAGAQASFFIRVVSPPDGEGEAVAQNGVRATLVDAAGRAASAEATAAFQRIDPAPVVPPVPWHEQPFARAGLALLTLVILGSATFALRRRAAVKKAWRDRETGIEIAQVHPPARYGVRDLSQRLGVHNASDRPRVAVLRVVECPPGWRASLGLARMPLSPGESAPVALHTSPDASIAPGTRARIILGCRPEEAQEHEERLELELEAPMWHVESKASTVDASPRAPSGGVRPVLRR